ncbi:hypothetical protein H8356DRAFT_1745529 [Neocallimastix lanati (nom. inval.)]|jgi:hypothetical protein|nr:hypothetical protein H8356DRAFT_1745529 [Neocallimastix sp. JGI-2020a]
MNDFNCGSGPSPISERLSLFKEIIRITKKKEERSLVDDFSYQNVRVIELVAVLNYIIALYNFGLPVDNLYTIVEVYEKAKNKHGSCYYYILKYIEVNFKSIHPVLLMLDQYTKDIYNLLKDEGQMISKFQFYIMAKAIASYQVHTQDVINTLAARLNQYNKELSNIKINSNIRLSSSSDATLVENNGELEEETTENVENDTRNSLRPVNSDTIKKSGKDELNDDDTLIDNPGTPVNNNVNTNKINSNTTTPVKFELQNNIEEEVFNINIEKKSMIYECITSLNVYSKFSNIKFDIPSYPSDELIEKIERQ